MFPLPFLGTALSFLRSNLLPIAACAAAGLAIFSYGYSWGSHRAEQKAATQISVMERAWAGRVIRVADASQHIVEKHIEYRERIKYITKTVKENVYVYVPQGTADLPGGFRVLHDAAARGEVPNPAGVTDAAPVPAQDAAATVAENYGTCNDTADQLERLQQWVTEAQKK